MKSSPALSATLELDEYVEAFELAWQQNTVPDIAEFTPHDDHPERSRILLEIIRADLEFRWHRGCQKSLEQYAIEFPTVLSDEDALSMLAFEEYRARRLNGELVSPGEYADEYQINASEWPEISTSSESSSGATRRSSVTRNREANQTHIADFPAPGTTLAGFHLQQELGRGAFSRVYLARQKDLAERFVVLKLSAEKLSEADKLAQLQHSNIVPIYSHHQLGDFSAVCMPYFGSTTMADLVASISGAKSLPPSGRAIVETLTNCAQRTKKVAVASRLSAAEESCDTSKTANLHRRVIRDSESTSEVVATGVVPTPLVTVDQCLRELSSLTYIDAVLMMGERLADGLHHAHQRGILHHDLKPANVLLADDGRPMLLDFNLSADVKSPTGQRGLHIGGTLPYMAPEQLKGFLENSPVNDVRSDIFSLGVILFELLTGDLPFSVRQGSFREIIPVMIAERRAMLPSIRLRNNEISPATEAIIRKCLAADPDCRYQTADQLKNDLTRQLKKLPLQHQREPSVRERLQKWTFRNPRLSTTISAGAVLLLLASAFGTVQERKRFQSVQAEIAALVDAGQSALDEDDPEVAQGRFLKAWMLAQGEPALQHQLSSFAGWLDHARRATLQRQLKWHVPPRDYETRRDEALLLCTLSTKDERQLLQLTLDAIDDSLTFATPNDPGWTNEADLLMLAKASLLRDIEGPESALQYLDGSDLSRSQHFHILRDELIGSMSQVATIVDEHAAAGFPIDRSRVNLLEAIEAARGKEFDRAGQLCESILNHEPQQFLARFLHAVCLTRSQRDSEAEVALRACLAQRPDFLWSEYFLCVIRNRTGRTNDGAAGLKRILEFSPSPALKLAAEAMLPNEVSSEGGDP